MRATGRYHTGRMNGNEIAGARAWHRLAANGRRALQVVLVLIKRFRADHCMLTAGSLSFTTLLAMVPMLTVALSLSTAFPVFDEAVDAVQKYVTENFMPDAAWVEKLADQLTAFAEEAARLTAVGLAFLTLTALMLMLTIDESLNRVFRVRRHRPLARRLLMYWSVLTLGPVLIGASLSITTFLVGQSLGLFDMASETETLLRRMPLLFTCAAFTMLYMVVPFRRVDARHALAGGLVAGVLFELAKQGFGVYITRVPTYTLIYGAFATLPIFLLWLYLSWLIVLLGATLTAAFPEFAAAVDERRRVPGRELLDALGVLATLARAQGAGGAVKLNRLASLAKLSPYRCEEVLERCVPLGWAAETDDGGWLLAKRPDTIRVADVYRAFLLDATGEDAAVLKGLDGALAAHLRQVDDVFALTVDQLTI
jgi:membrane protein